MLFTGGVEGFFLRSWFQSESIEWVLEDQASSGRMRFCSSRTPYPPLLSVSSNGDTQENYDEERVGEEPNHTTARNHGPLYVNQYSLISRFSAWSPIVFVLFKVKSAGWDSVCWNKNMQIGDNWLAWLASLCTLEVKGKVVSNFQCLLATGHCI